MLCLISRKAEYLMAFKKAALITDLWSGEMKGVTVDGQKILLINLEDKIYAYEDRCIHQAVALSEGRLEGKVITCSAHHWQYDACNGSGLNPRGIQLKTFAVKVEHEEVLVDTEQTGQRKGYSHG